MNAFSRTERERMKELMDNMDSNEHLQIFNIIKKYTDTYTKTQAGILVLTDNLNDECMKEINAYIIFSIDQHKRFDEDNKNRKKYERMVQ
jgi:hypothetical protein